MPALFAQDNRVLDETIAKFKGLGKEVIDNNPILSTVDKAKEKAKTLMNGTSAGGSSGTAAAASATPVAQNPKKDPEPQKKKPVAVAHKPVPPPRPPVAVAAIAPPPEPPKPQITVIREDQLASIQPGAERAAILASLGNPSSSTSINGGEDGVRETLVYHLDPEHAARIRLLDGKVTSVAR